MYSWGAPSTVALHVTKPYKFIGLGAMDVTKPYKFIVFGAMDVTKPSHLKHVAGDPLSW